MATSGTKTGVKKLAFESLAKGAGVYDNPALLKKVKTIFDPEHLEAYYSPEKFGEFTELLRKELYPGLARDKGLFELGFLGFRGFYKGTVVGGIMLAAIKVMKPLRLAKIGAQLWQDVGIGEVESEQEGSKILHIHYRNFWIEPYFPVGMTIEAFRTNGVREPTYDLTALPNTNNLFNFDVVYTIG